MPQYTLITAVAVVAVVALELLVLRTGVLRASRFWLAIGIVAAFQIAVDGWLTKLSDPVVVYDDAQTLGVRFPWDIPIEDFGFGFALVTLTICLWERAIRERS